MTKLSGYPDKPAPTDSDNLVIVDNSATPTTKKTTRGEFLTGSPISGATVSGSTVQWSTLSGIKESSILDINGKEILHFTPVTSAVNDFDIKNAATGNGPTISAKGSDSNVDINITPKGTGVIKLNVNGINQLGAWLDFTPTVTAATGTFTTATGAGRYIQIGKTIHYQVSCTITTVGTGTGCQFTLPVTAQSSTLVQIGTAREDAVTGNMGVVKLITNTTGSVNRYDNGNITSGGSGSVVRCFGTYEAA